MTCGRQETKKKETRQRKENVRKLQLRKKISNSIWVEFEDNKIDVGEKRLK